MSLTPLHFLRRYDGDNVFAVDAGPSYGVSIYNTDCDRFRFVKYSDVWFIEDTWMSVLGGYTPLNNNWSQWLSVTGLSSVEFPTRRDALEALHGALSADGLLDAANVPVPASA